MRISDWSSDVCSSDLQPRGRDERQRHAGREQGRVIEQHREPDARPHQRNARRQENEQARRQVEPGAEKRDAHRSARRRLAERSEEHTSELQSLMRISYAVFCLKKKKRKMRSKRKHV